MCELGRSAPTRATRRQEARRRRLETNLAIAAELERLREAEDLLAVKLSVPHEARVNCRLSHRLKRVRAFIPRSSMSNFDILKNSIYAYLLRLFPELNSTSHLSLLPDSHSFTLRTSYGDITSLQDLSAAIAYAGASSISDLQFTVVPKQIPGGTPPLPPMLSVIQQNAQGASELQMLSFYRFFPVEHPELFARQLKRVWTIYGITGRVYVATEGVNAQVAVPGTVWENFKDAMAGRFRTGVPYYDVPEELLGVFLNTDRPVDRLEVPFRDLRIIPRQKVLADGWAQPLDLNKAGKEIPPRAWHDQMKEGIDDAILLDCRNQYESEVGRFEQATTLDTKTFRETWEWLEKRLGSESRNKKILTYCTGGIRCVKVNAYLEQKMGFKDTGRLQGGIVSYARMLREQNTLDESKFRGVNHVFDARLGEEITGDVLSRCINCSAPATSQTDCSNPKCRRPFDRRLFVQCPDCAMRLSGACSEACRDAVLARREQLGPLAHFVAEPKETEASVETGRGKRLDEAYAVTFSEDEPSLLREIREFTCRRYPNRGHMVTGSLQGSLLKMLVASSGAKRVLELGTFTGYSTLYMAAALPEDGQLVTCEIDAEVAEIARSYFARHPANELISLRLGPALDTLNDLALDVHQSKKKPFDFAYIDADKKKYMEYYEILIGDGLLKLGGLAVLDNVLFRGQVAENWVASDIMSDVSDGEDDGNETRKDLRRSRGVIYSSVDQRRRLKSLENAKKISERLHDFNKMVDRDPRTEHVVLPVRDGITILRRVA